MKKSKSSGCVRVSRKGKKVLMLNYTNLDYQSPPSKIYYHYKLRLFRLITTEVSTTKIQYNSYHPETHLFYKMLTYSGYLPTQNFLYSRTLLSITNDYELFIDYERFYRFYFLYMFVIIMFLYILVFLYFIYISYTHESIQFT
jgi:hypothetical protein